MESTFSDSDREDKQLWLTPGKRTKRTRTRGTPNPEVFMKRDASGKWWHVPDESFEAMVKALAEAPSPEAKRPEVCASMKQSPKATLKRQNSPGGVSNSRSKGNELPTIQLKQPKMVFQENPKLFAPTGISMDGHRVPIPYTPFSQYPIYRGDSAHQGLARIRSLPCYTSTAQRRWGGA
eukprot:TRINITY_DN12338_c0_g1_i1.p1 TRINITY_DN12338_c0_g1~~TRINITY_DN12338_c0_g1_i1.p1  ORF type:complete len:179 (+),score=11.26 TRINITY_DN12338_c0_g1_i1:71-607(+)